MAIICDDLIQKGGAEYVFLDIINIFPEADIYTSVISKEWKNILKKQGREVKVSFIQKLPLAVKLNRYYSVLLLHILAFKSFDLTKYDLVLSLSARYAHFVHTTPDTKHVCYMHSPGRMFWEPFNYFKKLTYWFLKFPLTIIRMMDYTAAQKVDLFLANSKTAKKRIKKYYKRDSTVLYPAINIKNIKDLLSYEKPEEDYYLIISRLVCWKRIDIAIKAFNENGKKLYIAGSGPDIKRLKKSAESNICFLGYISQKEKYNLIQNAQAVVQTQKEDFGLVPLEAAACGTPVVAYKKGGALETIVENITGIFFDEQTPESINMTLNKFSKTSFDKEKLYEHAQEFDISKFEQNLRKFVYLDHKV